MEIGPTQAPKDAEHRIVIARLDGGAHHFADQIPVRASEEAGSASLQAQRERMKHAKTPEWASGSMLQRARKAAPLSSIEVATLARSAGQGESRFVPCCRPCVK